MGRTAKRTADAEPLRVKLITHFCTTQHQDIDQLRGFKLVL